MKNTPLAIKIGLAMLFIATMPSPAQALQTHGAPEGLYVHQIGHVLFAIAMLGFALRIRQSRLREEKSWRMMSVGALLFALWNGWALTGHFLTLHVSPQDFIRDSHGMKSALLLQEPMNGLYYILKMDHLICLPALILIYLALRRMRGRPVDRSTIEEKY